MAGRQANMRGTGGHRPACRTVLSRRVQSVAGDFSWRIATFFAQGLAWAIGAGFLFFFWLMRYGLAWIFDLEGQTGRDTAVCTGPRDGTEQK